ncbi:hypothetical protein JTB14_022223 [Gonioctena quinquepunctata]|nr:hypothetical protein JTB14_022223 [Gonioctena quinquepunctata]
MSSEKLRESLSEEESYFENKCSKKCFSLKFNLCLMFTVFISTIVVVMLTLVRVRRLENEIEIMKETLTSLNSIDNDLINALIGFDYEDIDSEDDLDKDPEILPGIKPDANFNEYIDYENYEQANETENNSTGYHQYQSPINLTKDGKEFPRNKRDIVAATQDGVVINYESYAEKKAKNGTAQNTSKGKLVTAYPAMPSSIGSPLPVHSQSYYATHSQRPTTHKLPTNAPPKVYTRQSRVMHHDDKSKAFRRIVKKSALKSGDSYMDSNEDITTASPGFTIIRDNGYGRYGNRAGRIKPLPAAHYNGDTSRYVYGQHSNYFGNGHMRHHQRTFVDWKSSDWVETLGMDAHFSFDNGYATIKASGLYLVYSQIFYLDEHDEVGYRVFKNDEMFLQCTLRMHSAQRSQKGNTCFTAGVEHFSEGDKVSLADITEGRLSLFEPGKSFFGLVKLGDAKIR